MPAAASSVGVQGGSRCARFLQSRLHSQAVDTCSRIFADHQSSKSAAGEDTSALAGTLRAAVERVFQEVDAEFLLNAQETKIDDGSCALIAVCDAAVRYMAIAHAGDCR